MTERVRVLLVDDHLIVRRGLARLLAAEAGVEIVGEAADGVEALELLSSAELAEPPHVALVDVHMPRMNGTELVERLRVEHPGISVVVLTSFDEDEHLFACLRSGAKGYLLKDAELDDVAGSVHRAARGESTLLGYAAERMIAGITPPVPTPVSPVTPPADHGLTARELDVTHQVGSGATNREIARALHISEGTVRNHITSVLRRLDLRDRTALALWYNDRH
ncbi:response regulator [Nocardiopsis oceani]